MSRDHAAKLEEESGELAFRYVMNDGTAQHIMWLINLKNIFAKQLPKMPREYICRLVMDRNHRSMVVVKRGKVIGGICYRPYFPQQFAEIAFCAISTEEQVKGYGTRLMNHLKAQAIKDNLDHFLTYADNFAIGYFSKQEFHKTVLMPRERWAPYIKEYDGGTLMECEVNFKLAYTDIPGMVRKYRQMVYDRLRKVSNSHIVYEGISAAAHSFPLNSDLIPGLREPSETSASASEPPAKRGKWSAAEPSAIAPALSGAFDRLMALPAAAVLQGLDACTPPTSARRARSCSRAN